MYFSFPVEIGGELCSESEQCDATDTTFIESVILKNHPFDANSSEKSVGICDFPNIKKTFQIRGEFGPRFYNKVSVGQQLAQVTNLSLKNIS